MPDVTTVHPLPLEGAAEPSKRTIAEGWLYPVFFLSGFAALLYQVIWQRTLLTIYGTNVESVAIVVTAFLLGLGLGSLGGGAVSKIPGCSPLFLFCLAELSIGCFGLTSLSLFNWIGHFTLRLSGPGTSLTALLLVLFPTVLMGGTLPLLTAHAVKGNGNVGRSVAALYFVNTLGSALASLVAAFFLLRMLGLQGTTWIAAGLNLLAAGVSAVFLGGRGGGSR
jgi:predicted membrane-bound spermidine synthase